ncbi:MAG: PmoA family protein [Planctomycetota bacterium]
MVCESLHSFRACISSRALLLFFLAIAISGCLTSKSKEDTGSSAITSSSAADLNFKVHWNEARDQVDIAAGCHLLTTLRLDQPRPCLFPLYSPAGSMVLRRWPMEQAIEGESKDHPHHAGAWIAHGSVAGHDFWHGKETRQVPSDWDSILLDDEQILVVSGKLSWVADGQKILEETRTYDFRVEEDRYSIEIWSLWKPAGDKPVKIGDTKEGTFALRLAPTLRLDGPVAAGKSFNADGATAASVWGKRSRWVAYSGPIDGQEVTVAILDHPENLSHPTWWHARTYGLFAANPFGQHDFERTAAGSGDIEITPGDNLFFRHQLLVFDGAVTAQRIEKEWANFSNR